MIYKILIADDEKIVVDSIKFILENNLKEENIEITTFLSGREALENLLFYQYHIAFIDIKMPDLDGLELIEE